jgi:hypothetical protein
MVVTPPATIKAVNNAFQDILIVRSTVRAGSRLSFKVSFAG